MDGISRHPVLGHKARAANDARRFARRYWHYSRRVARTGRPGGQVPLQGGQIENFQRGEPLSFLQRQKTGGFQPPAHPPGYARALLLQPWPEMVLPGDATAKGDPL